jgi:hypothetical protein
MLKQCLVISAACVFIFGSNVYGNETNNTILPVAPQAEQSAETKELLGCKDCNGKLAANCDCAAAPEEEKGPTSPYTV